jgi:acetylornithine deacetylase
MNPKISLVNQAPLSEGVIPLLEKLISFNTVSRESNLGLIDWARDYFKSLGLLPKLSYDAKNKKANLFVTVGGGSQGGILLSGHTDTVPVDGQAWNSDPFTALLQDGRIYGRGSVDMKGFLAVCMAFTHQVIDLDLKRPIHIAMTYDEETTMLGVRHLLADMREAGLTPAGCIVGEPTAMRVIVGHKGRQHVQCHVRGKEAHSSLTPIGVNAIEHAARIIEFLRAKAELLKNTEARHYGYDVPYTTIQTSLISGGLSANTVPQECSFDFEFRNLPSTNMNALLNEVQEFAQQKVLPEMQSIHAESSINFSIQAHLPPFGSQQENRPLDSSVADFLKMIDRKNAPLGYVGFGTEASWYQSAGIPTIILGPGSIEQAHQPNEYIELSQLAMCEDFLMGLVR